MPEESIDQISTIPFTQSKGTEAFMISNHLRTSSNTLEVDQMSLRLDHLLNPPSIFPIGGHAHKLDRYLKIKISDKPKDTLRQIMSRKREFQQYIKGSLIQQTKNQAEVDQVNHHLMDQSRQACDHTFAKYVENQTILVVKITASFRCKCNIVVFNLRGEALKYYRNVLLIKKSGKILKIFKQFEKHFFLVFDRAEQDFDDKYFLPLLKGTFWFCYHMSLAQQSYHFSLAQIEEIEEKYAVRISNLDQNLEIKKLRPNFLFLEEMLTRIQIHFFEKQRQQEEFLVKLRGQRVQEARDLCLDLMAVNLWRQSSQGAGIIVNKINYLFDMKAENVRNMVPKQKQGALHLPIKMEKEQNCAQCLSKNLNKLKPRRTFWICDVCSAEMEKPLYLCRKDCFGDYHRNIHSNNNVCLFRKNQKKTTKTLKQKRRLAAHKQDHLPNYKKQAPPKLEEPQLSQNTQKEQLFNKLNRLQEQYFDKIGSLIQEGQENQIKSCNFFLAMLLNTNIQCLQKINNQKETNKMH